MRSSRLEHGKKYAITQLIKYIIIALTVLLGIKALGFDMTFLIAGSAALLVGIGFGLQNIFNDFISGIIILLDGTLKIDDIIEVNGNIYKVVEINFRTTNVVGRDENYAILPNSELTRNKIIHWTHYKTESRFKVTIGVDYSTDINLLIPLLKKIALEHNKVEKQPEPFVRFEDYADSALIFSLFFFTNDVFRVENTKSELRVSIFNRFKENGITIPFPQRVIHYPEK